MKRIVVIACMFMLCASTMYGGTLIVPFFNDSGDTVDPSTLAPTAGENTFIRVQNVTGGSINVTVSYYNASGLIHVNTGVLSASEIWAWRPHGGQGLPPDSGGVVTPEFTMSAVLTWTGGSNTDLAGNVVTINQNGSRMGMNLIQ